jgi:Xaa-Pro aminopeptidase
MNRDAFNQRLSRFRKLMNEQNLDTFLVAVPENRYYLSGYEAEDFQLIESSGYLLISETQGSLLTDFRYQEQAKQESPDFELVVYEEGIEKILPDLFTNLRTERIGIEGHFLTYQKCQEVEKAFETAGLKGEVVATEGLVEKLRLAKEPEEIERIRTSLALTERVLVAVWETLEPGREEKDVAWEIERRTREEGAESVSFPPIVASGPNAALPHAVPTHRRIATGETVIIDMGARLSLYCSDMTRTWIAGTPDKKLQEIYRIVREAQLAAQDAACAGMETTDLDKVARDVIEEAGYGEYFGHGLGHGVGLAVHEKPGLRRYQPTTLEENMVVTIEPGIYLPRLGGVRLENMVRITKTGCELLNGLELFYQW